MVKRTSFWSLVVGAVAAVLPAAAAVRADAAPAPAKMATAPLRAPEPGRLEEARPLVDAEQRDEREDVPAPSLLVSFDVAVTPRRAPAIRLPQRSPEVAVLSRRSLGRTRVRAPTQPS